MKSFIMDSLAFSGKILNSRQYPPWRRVPATCHKFNLYIFTWQGH